MKMFRSLLVLLAMISLVGCASKIPHKIVPDYTKRSTKLIAVMPVRNNSPDPNAAALLRTKLIEALYFKGYPKISLKAIDDRLAGASPGGVEAISPKLVGELLKVDAVLYPVLIESRKGRGIFYASTAVEVEFELRGTKTGEELWRVRYRTVHRNFDFSRRRMELKVSQVYEPTIQETITRALETLPDGSDAVGL